MNKLTLAALITSVTMGAMAADLENIDNKISYSIGTQMGGSLKSQVSQAITVDAKAVIEGITDVLEDKALQLTPEQMQEAMKKFSEIRIEAQQKAAAEAASKNKAEGDKLLADNKKIEGVKVTKSGLQYRVITEGTGKKPTAEDTVKVHYVGTLADGSEFDSSIKRGEPVEFPLKGVIPGWTEGVQLMNTGSKFEFVIPSELAYGERGPGQIGPHRTLKFEVELLDIVDTTTKEAETKKVKEEAKATQSEEKKGE